MMSPAKTLLVAALIAGGAALLAPPPAGRCRDAVLEGAAERLVRRADRQHLRAPLLHGRAEAPAARRADVLERARRHRAGAAERDRARASRQEGRPEHADRAAAAQTAAADDGTTGGGGSGGSGGSGAEPTPTRTADKGLAQGRQQARSGQRRRCPCRCSSSAASRCCSSQRAGRPRVQAPPGAPPRPVERACAEPVFRLRQVPSLWFPSSPIGTCAHCGRRSPRN